jgi:hypothetical protein
MRPSSKFVALLLSLVCGGAAEAGGKLNLVNVRATYGVHGPVRADNKYLPGDKIDLSFDIDNITIDPKTGQAKWEIVMDVFDDKKPKPIFSSKNPNEMVAALGGHRLPAFCFVTMALDSSPGKYTLRVSVTDLANKAKATHDHKFTVTEKGFGIVKVMAQSVGFIGQSSGVSFEVVGMQRDKKELFDVQVSMRVFDATTGKPTLKDPLSGEFPKDLPEKVEPKTLNALPVLFPIELTRPGRFRVEIEAVDRLAKNRKSKVSYTINVVDAGGK